MLSKRQLLVVCSFARRLVYANYVCIQYGYDKETKLVHFGYRDYDPYTGKWTVKWGQVMNLTPLKNTGLNINSKNDKNGKIYLINKEISLGSSPDPYLKPLQEIQKTQTKSIDRTSLLPY